jgi:hypothetical protein
MGSCLAGIQLGAFELVISILYILNSYPLLAAILYFGSHTSSGFTIAHAMHGA